MCKNLTAFAKKYGRAALLAVSALGTASCLPLLLSRPLRDAIVSYGSRLAGKQINAPFWDEWLFRTGLKYFALFAYVLVLTIFWKQVVSFVKYVLQNSKTLHICILVLTALTVFNSFRSLNIPVSGITLDPSWIWAINKIPHIDNFIFGRDAVFTYGPLGFIFMPADYASHIALSFFANIVCVTLLIISLKGTFKKLPAEQKLFFSLPVFLFIPFTSFEWLWNITLFVCAANCFQNRQNRRFYLWISVFAALSGVSLVIKFNTAVLAGAMAFMLGVALLFADIKKTLAYAALFAVMYCSVTLLNIGMLFKDIRNFLLWFRMSLEVAGGFSYAMAINGSVPLALFAIAVIIGYCVFIKKTYKRDTDLLALFLLGFPVMFFSFKHGFVRQDGHMSAFFTACPLLLALILLHTEWTRPKFRRFFAVVSVVSLMYHFIVADIGVINYSRNLYYAVKLPHNLLAFEQRKKDAHAADALPDEWNEIIGANTIQILPWELSYAQANNWIAGGGGYK